MMTYDPNYKSHLVWDREDARLYYETKVPGKDGFKTVRSLTPIVKAEPIKEVPWRQLVHGISVVAGDVVYVKVGDTEHQLFARKTMIITAIRVVDGKLEWTDE